MTVSEKVSLMMTAIMLVLWVLWTLFSPTRYNHGMLIAFLLPLAPIIIPMVWITFKVIQGISFGVFCVLGRKQDHKDFMVDLKRRWGIGLF